VAEICRNGGNETKFGGEILTMDQKPRFYFSTCQIGAEKALKNEIAKHHPRLKFSFSRPGFITFKDDTAEGEPILKVKSIFSRLWGVVLAQTKERGKVDEVFAIIPQSAKVQAFSRDEFVPGDEPDRYSRDTPLLALLKEKSFKRANEANSVLGESIYDLIWVDDFHLFLGMHVHAAHYDGSSGNLPKLSLPEKAPSRAYLKIAEAVHRFKPELPKGLQVIEVGCSPGGATSALLGWGAQVVGVDPKRMDPEIERNPNFRLIQKPANQVQAMELKLVNPEWIVIDMNIAPLEALDELSHVINCLRRNFDRKLLLKRGFLTIKLNDWKFADSIPLYLARIQEMGFRNLTATQLASNRQEFFVMANGFE